MPIATTSTFHLLCTNNGAHFLKESNGQNLLKSGTLQNGKNPPGLESRDNRSQIEAAHGAFTDVTHCRNASGEDETWANLRREVSAWNQCKERQKLLTENLRAPRELPPRRPTTSRYYIGVSCRKRVPFTETQLAASRIL